MEKSGSQLDGTDCKEFKLNAQGILDRCAIAFKR